MNTYYSVAVLYSKCLLIILHYGYSNTDEKVFKLDCSYI